MQLEALTTEALACGYHDPFAWAEVFIDNTVERRLGNGRTERVDPGYTPDQHHFGMLLSRFDRVVCPAGQAVGKSHGAAIIGHWWMQTRSPAKVITTGPGISQVKGVLWKHIRAIAKKARIPLQGAPLPENPEWRIDDESFMYGISVRELDAMSGRHSPNMLVLIDEGNGVRAEIWIAVEGLASSEGSKVFAIGNPFDPSGPFYEAARSPVWKCYSISCLNHPNVVTGREMFPGMVTRSWVKAREIEWAGNPWLFSARVKGEFPTQGDMSLISMDWVEQAMKSGDEANPIVPLLSNERPVLACDVADGGGDESVITVFEGNKQSFMLPWAGQSPNEAADRIVEVHKEFHPSPLIVVDAIGVGAAIPGILARMEGNYSCLPYKGSYKAREEEDFPNTRAQAHWDVREALRRGEMRLIDDPRLRSQLCSIRRRPHRDGRIHIEEKFQVKSRLKGTGSKSPDRSDAVVMAWWGRLEQLYALGLGRPKKKPDPKEEDGFESWHDRMMDMGAQTLIGERQAMFRELIG